MRYSSAVVVAALASSVSAHGVIDMVMGANGVNMPGLSVADGTPRDCASPACGSEMDTSIIRTQEMGTSKASALGRTKAGGPVDAAKVVSVFMGSAPPSTVTNAQTNNGGGLLGRGLLDGLLGGNKGGAGGAGGAGGNGGGAGGLGALLGGGGSGAPTSQGTKTPSGAVANTVASTAGKGKTAGLPTTDDQGAITMNFHQVNQDGAGPLSADVDATSGGTDPNAFQKATVMMDVPGIGIGGLSGATTTDFPVKVQMPQGMTCSGKVAGVNNVCIVRMQNQALAGPFGGSAAFTQSPAAKKRAVEYNLRKRHFARGVLGAEEKEESN